MTKKLDIKISYDRDSGRYDVTVVTLAQQPVSRDELCRILRSITEGGLEAGAVTAVAQPRDAATSASYVYLVNCAEYGESEVHCIATTEHRARKEARRRMGPGAEQWIPRPSMFETCIVMWENPAKSESVSIHRHELLGGEG